MNTDLILWFRMVYESGTIAKAAELLNITPGALSRAMKRLEVELNCQLFVSSGRNVLPNEAARSFYTSSEEILRSLEKARLGLKNKIHQQDEFKLATFEVFSTHFASWMIETQKLEMPLLLVEATPGEIEKNVLTGIANFGLTYMPELHPELDHLVIGEMPLGVYVSAKKKNADLPFAVPITEVGISYLQTKSLDGWPVDIPRKIKYRFQMLETALDLSSRGCSKILCPKFIIQIENQRLSEKFKLVEEKQEIRLPRLKIYAVKRKNTKEDHMFKKLCKSVRIALNL